MINFILIWLLYNYVLIKCVLIDSWNIMTIVSKNQQIKIVLVKLTNHKYNLNCTF